MINRYCGGNLNPWNIPATRVNKIKALTIVALSAIAAATFTLALLASLGINLHALNVLSALTIYGSAGAGLVSSAIFATALAWLITKICHRNPPPVLFEEEGGNRNSNRLPVEIHERWGAWDNVNVNQGDQNDHNIQRVLQESEQTGNILRLQQKTQLMQTLQPYFRGGVRKLKEYFNDDAVGADPPTLYQVTLIGLLQVFQANIRQNQRATFMQGIQTYCDQYLPDLNRQIQPHLNTYGEQWRAMLQHYNAFQLINMLILQAVKGAVNSNNSLSISEEDYRENKYEELKVALQPLADNQAFQNLYKSLEQINQAIFSSDNELLRVVAGLSGISN